MKARIFQYSAVVAAAMFVTTALAQDPFGVTVGEVSGLPGQTVQVPVSIFGNDDSRVVQFNVEVADVTAFSDIDDAACDSEKPVGIGGFCQYEPANERFLYAMDAFAYPGGPEFPTVDPIGYLTFTIDAGTPVGTVIDLTITDVIVENAAPVDAVHGSIEVIDTPPEELSELSVSPDPLNFGTVDLGNMPVTDTITATNTGGSLSSLTISAANYAGDAEFSVVGDDCTGTTLAEGDSCVVTIEFDSGANGTFNGTLSFSSDADSNPNPVVDITGSADSVASLSANPAFGAWNLGSGNAGTVVSANGSISNTGSAPGDFACTLDDVTGVFSTSPSPLAGTVAAGGSFPFSVSCALPSTAEDGESFSASLSCTGDEGFGGEYALSCSVSEFEPLPVPTMQTWSLILFALMMLIIGGFSIRFFRAG